MVEPEFETNKQPYTLFVQAEDVVEMNAEVGQDPSVISSDALTSQTVAFLDNDPGVGVTAESLDDEIALVDGTEDLQLGSFLSRPTRIASDTWTAAEFIGVKAAYDPWSLFLGNTVIQRKLQNFAFLRGTMHTKVIINGTPFQYGALRVVYSPLEGFTHNKVRGTVGVPQGELISYSQQPGFFVFPQANAGGELELPFVLHKNWLDITSAAEVAKMGTLRTIIYAPLASAVAGGSTAVTIHIYAWMTNVLLMGSTMKLNLQAKDEYQEGLISSPATAVANIASTLTRVPILGRFARATEIGANSLAAIARLFGYTNAPVIENVSGFMPLNGPMLASAHIGTAAQKLTLDPKQELSIDPRPHGAGSEDELSLAYLKKKESFFYVTSWQTSDLAGAQIFNMRVNPALMQTAAITNVGGMTVANRVYHTPLSYIGEMFKQWRGGLVLRIKVVATKFHKGRLKISYDPRGDIAATNPDENMVYTQILDIGEQDDLEIEMPFHQDVSWLDYDRSLQENYSYNGHLTPRIGTDNGTLSIRVLNTLTAPASGTVNIMFFIRAADDFEFANPADHIGGSAAAYPTPSFFEVQAEDHTELVPTRVILGKSTQPSPDRYGLNYGECVTSLRTLIHRSVLQDTAWVNSVAANAIQIIHKVFKIMPYTPGFVPGTWLTSAQKVVAIAGNAPYAFNCMPHIPYIAGMFLGYRGSTTYTVTPGLDRYGDVTDMRVTRTTDPTAANERVYFNGAGILASSTLGQRTAFANVSGYPVNGLSGMAITATQTNGSLVFNLPDFKRFNFSLVDPTVYSVGTAEDGTDTQGALLQIMLRTGASSETNTFTIQSEVCAGPDFQCLFFLCCPTLDYLITTPVPV